MSRWAEEGGLPSICQSLSSVGVNCDALAASIEQAETIQEMFSVLDPR
jgi:hypothetical protein